MSHKRHGITANWLFVQQFVHAKIKENIAILVVNYGISNTAVFMP